LGNSLDQKTKKVKRLEQIQTRLLYYQTILAPVGWPVNSSAKQLSDHMEEIMLDFIENEE